jgi:hypothetical protein
MSGNQSERIHVADRAPREDSGSRASGRLGDGWDALREYRDVEQYARDRLDETEPDGLIQELAPELLARACHGRSVASRSAAVREARRASLAVAGGLCYCVIAFLDYRAVSVEPTPAPAGRAVVGDDEPRAQREALVDLAEMARARGSGNDRRSAGAEETLGPAWDAPSPGANATLRSAIPEPRADMMSVTPQRVSLDLTTLATHEAPVHTPPPLDAVVTEMPRAAGEVPEEERIRATLMRFRSAYSELDAEAARGVWPSVDVRALARAFEGLKTQALLFDRCDLSVNGIEASAACSGQTTYTPRVGTANARTDRREWNFRLRKVDEAWTIASANAR